MLRRHLLVGTACALIGAGCVGLAWWLTARGDSVVSPPTAAAAQADQTFLFSQDAAGGTLRGPDDQHLVLRLTGVRDSVTRFADRPARDAQTVDIRDFLARWQERFAASPPNAVLSYRLAGSPDPRDIVLELSHPRYDAATHTATYDARRITRTADRLPGTRHPLQPVVYPIPATFRSAAVFIDDAGDNVRTAPYIEGPCANVSAGFAGVGGYPVDYLVCPGAPPVVFTAANSLPDGISGPITVRPLVQNPPGWVGMPTLTVTGTGEALIPVDLAYNVYLCAAGGAPVACSRTVVGQP